MGLLDTDLFYTPSDRLDAWIAQNLLPDEEFRAQNREATRRIAEFLREACFRDATVLKVVKGGSSAKGTSMKNGSDADIVVFVSRFESFKDQTEELGNFIKEVREMLRKRKQSIAYDIDIEEPKEKLDPKGQLLPQRAVSFTIQSRKVMESVSVDLLPAYNALGYISTYVKPDPKVYVSLIRARGRPGEFSPCFTELQRNFVKPLPGKLKNLIRLVKHWYKENVKNKCEGISLPPKYALELLTIYAWEQGSGEKDFRTEEGFCTVLQLLCHYKKICIYWTSNYDFANPIVGDFLRRQLMKPRPVILDPADPTGIVGQGACWDYVAQEAKRWLQSASCMYDVQPWDVQLTNRPQPQPHDKQIIVKNSNDKTYTFHVRSKTSVLDIKTMVELRTKIPMEQQRLIYGSQNLQDDKTLKSYTIPHEATLLLKVKR